MILWQVDIVAIIGLHGWREMQRFLKIEADQWGCCDHMGISVLSVLYLGFSLFRVSQSINEHDLLALP